MNIRHFEMLTESISNSTVNLVCSRRPPCHARLKLPIINGLWTEKVDGKYKLEGSSEEKKNVHNYGQAFHTHTKKCKGKVFALLAKFQIIFRGQRRSV